MTSSSSSSDHRIIVSDDCQSASTAADWSRLSHIPRDTLTTAIPNDQLVDTLLPYSIIHAM
jgi:hypothetical protein